MTKQELMKEISIQEHLVDTYSRMDPERVPALEVKIKTLEWKLLDVMVAENEDWLEMFKEQQE